MKYEYEKVNINTNLNTNDSSNFEIGDQAKIFELAFKDLYNFKIRTCVQEYVSNAIDAHNSAKKCVSKIKISAPTAKDLFFRVKDCGLGLTREELTQFVRLGISNSEKYDDALGGFGYGSKIGFAVSDFFFVTSVKDGIKYTCEATKKTDRKEDYAQLNVHDKSKTNEENGLEIMIPVKRTEISEWKEGIERVCRHLEVKPEVINHKLPKDESFILEDEDFKYYKNGYKEIFITLGNIEYPLDYLKNEDKIEELFPDIKLRLKIPTNAFRPQRNRELLDSNPEVNKIILDQARKVQKKILKMYTDKLKNLNLEEICTQLKDSPFLDEYEFKKGNFKIKVTELGISEIKYNNEYLPYIYGYNHSHINAKSTSFANSRFRDYEHYSKTIVINDTDEDESDRIKKIKMFQNTGHRKSYSYSWRDEKYVYSTIMFVPNNILNDKDLEILKSFMGEKDVLKLSELEYHIPKRESKAKKKEKGSFTATDANTSNRLLDNIEKNSIYIPREEWFNLERNVQDDFWRYARDKKLDFYILSKTNVKKFKSKKIKALNIDIVKKYMLKKYPYSGYNNALSNIIEYSSAYYLKKNDKYVYLGYSNLKKIEYYLPKKIKKYLKDFKKSELRKSNYVHSFMDQRKNKREYKKEHKLIEEEITKFVHRNYDFFELVKETSFSFIEKNKKRKTGYILKLLRDLK